MPNTGDLFLRNSNKMTSRFKAFDAFVKFDCIKSVDCFEKVFNCYCICKNEGGLVNVISVISLFCANCFPKKKKIN